MRIVAIDASPARGVVSQSVEEAAKAAEKAGATVVRVRLSDLSIRSCTGCGMCRYTEACKIPDDLPALAAEIAEADGVIFGVPSYFRRPEGQAKALMDRINRFFPYDGQLQLQGGLSRVYVAQEPQFVPGVTVLVAIVMDAKAACWLWAPVITAPPLGFVLMSPAALTFP